MTLLSIWFIAEFIVTCTANDHTYSDVDKYTRGARSAIFLSLGAAVIAVGCTLDHKFKQCCNQGFEENATESSYMYFVSIFTSSIGWNIQHLLDCF